MIRIVPYVGHLVIDVNSEQKIVLAVLILCYIYKMNVTKTVHNFTTRKMENVSFVYKMGFI